MSKTPSMHLPPPPLAPLQKNPQGQITEDLGPTIRKLYDGHETALKHQLDQVVDGWSARLNGSWLQQGLKPRLDTGAGGGGGAGVRGAGVA